MCTQIKKVYNVYSGKSLYTSCGQCEACQQAKANKRTQRIRNNVSEGTITLFVTLTYDRWSCPVVLRSDLEERKDPLPVYRLVQSRNVRVSSDYKIKRKRKYEPKLLNEYENIIYDQVDASSLPRLAKLSSKYVGICYYEDFKNFFKRLRHYVTYKSKGLQVPAYSYYLCSEYGETTLRPHAHILLTIPSSQESFFRKAILHAWPFADYRRSSQYIEVARDAASYVSSYVNSGADFPTFFKNRCFRPKCSYSKGYGRGLAAFSLKKLLDALDKHALYYSALSYKDGVPQISRVPIPAYVINSYFPKCKGYSFRNSSAQYHLLVNPLSQIGVAPEKNTLLTLSQEEAFAYLTRLKNAFSKYHYYTGRNYLDFILDHIRIWNEFKQTSLRSWYDEMNLNGFQYSYDNINEYVLKHPLMSHLFPIRSPNLFPQNIERHARLSQMFSWKKKTKKVVNYSMSQSGHYV